LVPLALAALFFSVRAAAQEPAGESPADGVALDPRIASIDIELSLDPDNGLMVQNTSMEIRGYNLRRLSLAINRGLTVERVQAADSVVEHRKSGGRLDLYFSPPIKGRRVLRLRITGSPTNANGEERIEPGRVVLAPEDHWYPTFPGFWADSRVTVRAPEGWTAVAPGVPGDGGKAGRTWTASRPVRGLAVIAAPDLRLTESGLAGQTLRVAGPADGPSAGEVAAVVAQPMAWFSAALASYPFDGFTLVILPDLNSRIRASGLLAVPTGTAIGGPEDGADLLAGQWFGELIAGDGPWIESFAAWYATIYARDRSLGLPQEIARLRREYFELSSARDVAISRAGEGAAEAVLRGKGSAAPDMVRLAVGDRQVQEAIRELFQMPISGPVALGQIRSAFEKQAGVTPLRSFVEWFDRKGAPEFETAMDSRPAANGEWQVDLVLKQIRGVYSLPVEVEFVGPEQRHREIVQVEDETTEVSYSLPFRPMRLEIDPAGKLFRRDSG